jgi:hypothetical protein
MIPSNAVYHLVIPSFAVYDTACENIVGAKLEVLTLTDAGDPDVHNWVRNLPSRKAQHYPSLTRVQLYYAVLILIDEPDFTADNMLKSGIEYFRVHPQLLPPRLRRYIPPVAILWRRA